MRRASKHKKLRGVFFNTYVESGQVVHIEVSPLSTMFESLGSVFGGFKSNVFTICLPFGDIYRSVLMTLQVIHGVS